MGLSSSTTKTVNTPSPQQTQAGNTLNTAFSSAFPRIQGYADQIGGLIPNLMEQAQHGDSGVNASRDWITRTLQGDGSNPNLQGMIDQSGMDTARSINANIGTRGLTGGSVQQHILAQELAKQSIGLRYNDWQSGQQRQAQAAGMAPGVAAGSLAPIASLLQTAQFAGGSPLNAASQYASGMGSLFGNTGTQSTTQSGGLLGNLLGAALGGWGVSGFKGI